MCKFVEEIFVHSEDSKTVNNTTLLVSGTPLTAIALFQGSMDQPLVFLKSSHTIYVEGFWSSSVIECAYACCVINYG